MSCRAGRASCPSQADGPEMAHQTRWSHAAIGRDIRRKRLGMSPQGDDGQDVLLETIERWSSRTRSQDRDLSRKRPRKSTPALPGPWQRRSLTDQAAVPPGTARSDDKAPAGTFERKDIPTGVYPQPELPARATARDDALAILAPTSARMAGRAQVSRPEPERQTRPSEMKVSLRTRRQTLSEPVLQTADGVDPSGQRVVRGPSQRQQGSPRLRPEVGPGPQVRSPAPRGAVRKPQ